MAVGLPAVSGSADVASEASRALNLVLLQTSGTDRRAKPLTVNGHSPLSFVNSLGELAASEDADRTALTCGAPDDLAATSARPPPQRRRVVQRINVSVVAIQLRKQLRLLELVPPSLGTEAPLQRAVEACRTFHDDMAFLLSNNAPRTTRRERHGIALTCRAASTPKEFRDLAESLTPRILGPDGEVHILSDVTARELLLASHLHCDLKSGLNGESFAFARAESANAHRLGPLF